MTSNYEWTARFDFEVEYSKMPAMPDIFECTVEDGIYVIQCSFSPESVIDVQGGSWDPRANIQLWKSNGTMAQAFLFRYDEAAGAYEITNAKSEMALDVQGGSMSSGVNVQQYAPNSTEGQRWSVVPNEDGTFTLSPAGHPELAPDARNQHTGLRRQRDRGPKVGAKENLMKQAYRSPLRAFANPFTSCTIMNAISANPRYPFKPYSTLSKGA